MTKNTNRKLPRRVRLAIEEAAIKADLGHAKNRCAVDQEAQDKMRLYLQSWVLGALLDVLNWDDGHTAANEIWPHEGGYDLSKPDDYPTGV